MLTLFALLSLLFSSPAETCATIHALVGGELVEWIGYPTGWNLPADLDTSGHIDFESGGVVQYTSRSEHARYLFVFTSYEATTDGNGEHLGQHSFCGPYRIAE